MTPNSLITQDSPTSPKISISLQKLLKCTNEKETKNTDHIPRNYASHAYDEMNISGPAEMPEQQNTPQQQQKNPLGKDPIARELFEYLIYPITISQFYQHYWEKRPLIIKRKSPQYYHSLFTLSHLKDIIFEEKMRYTQDLDVTIYKDKKRYTLNPKGEGKIDAKWVWKQFQKKGCSVRLNYPQEHSNSVWELCSQLENWFGMGVSSNSYLTPAGSGGFAPHYDDVDVFLLQTEGAKQWKLYADSPTGRYLARESSPNFHEKDIGKPSHEFVLEQGDMLYMPRGTIHMGRSLTNSPSLHLTVSTGLKTTWFDFIGHTLEAALEGAHLVHPEFRQSMPRQFFSYMGVSNVENGDKVSRQNFTNYFRYLMSKLAEHAPLDEAADALSEAYFHDRLPPFVCGDPDSAPPALKKEIKATNQVVLSAPDVCRVVNGDIEDETLFLLFCTRNSRRYRDKPKQYLECELGLAPALEKLIHSYPKRITVQDLYDSLIFENAPDTKDSKQLQSLFYGSLHEVLEAMHEEKILKIFL